MCTVVILHRPGHDWPMLLATNRDEMADRPWRPPGRHWPDRANVTAGIDELAGGTWLGVNDEGVVAAILNRRDSLGPDARLRSRGELVLEALDHFDAAEAAPALGDLDGASYRSFNMIVADNRDAFWLKSPGAAADGRIAVEKIPPGLSMITSAELNDPAAPRISHYRPRFEAAAAPDPETGDWSGWETLLSCRDSAPGAGPAEAMTIVTDHGFGTLSSSLIALPGMHRGRRRPIWRFAAGRPGEAPWKDVSV